MEKTWLENEKRFISLIPSKKELDEILTERLAKFRTDNGLTTKIKAQDFVNFNDQVLQIQNPKNGRQPFVFMTINPTEDTEFIEFDSKVQSTCENYLTWSYRSYELSKTGRMHVHILGLIKKERQNSNFSRIKDSYINEYIGNSKHFDIKYVPEDQLPKTYSYLSKSKVAKSKDAANKLTLDWRLENSIEPIISTGDPLLVWSPPQLIN